MKDLISKGFCSALKDYQYLLERNYPRKVINEIIGNRYGLSRIQRSAMHRGMASKTDIENRKGKLALNINNVNIYIDAFNLLYTITNYLMGRTVFVALDGFLRDTGEVTGKNRSSSLFYKAIDDTVEVLSEQKVKSAHFYFDYPVSHSGDLAKLVAEKLSEKKIMGDGGAVKSPDNELKKINTGIVATSDSAILDNTGAKIFDLARFVIEKKYNPELVYISEIID